jgi:chromosome segregation ATPase
MSSRPDLRDVVRDEERRRRDEAKIIALQQQIDEMRNLVRELTSRQTRNDDQFKNYELALAQLRTSAEQHRHEVAQSLQARQLEDGRVRQQLTELDARIEETGRPIRSIQAHITEIVETLRRGKDDSDDDLHRFEELRTLIEHVAAFSERNTNVIQVTREAVESLRAKQDETQRSLQLVEDSVKIAEQDFRRRIAEVDQDTHNLASRIEGFPAVFGQHEAMMEEIRESLVHIDPALEELASVDGQLHADIGRFVTQADERDELLSERIDEIRRQFDSQVRDIRQVAEQRSERVNQRVDALVDVDRELGYRLNVLELRIEEVRELYGKLRRELWHLHELRSRMRLDQAQAELEAVSDARRATEQDMTPERGERPGGAS